MKKVLLLLLTFCSAFIYAQSTEPIFEKEGKMVKATYFHDNGEIAQMGYMLNGKLHGDWTMFDAKGSKIAAGYCGRLRFNTCSARELASRASGRSPTGKPISGAPERMVPPWAERPVRTTRRRPSP